MSSSYTMSSPLLATRANNFNRKETAMTMIQQPNTIVSPPPPSIKRRNQHGNRNLDAEVIALSPTTIMATNTFLCEVCNKGFNREQNLQLHGRLHNLPWKLKQKLDDKDVRRKVYICPEPTCVHHVPSRALGDLTGIRKHYHRKHCEKKWKCEKCPKRYALQSDRKAHSKICGTKEYRCDCGTIFSRRDAYKSHKILCDALKQETSARNPTGCFPDMGAAGGGSGGRHGFYGSAASALGGNGFYGRLASALPHNQFGNNLNTGLTPPAAAYNLNRSSSNQGLLGHNGQSLRTLGDRINNNINNTNHGYFQNNTRPSNQTLFTHGAGRNDPSALLRGLASSSPSGVVVNGFGDNGSGNFQGLMNSLDVTANQQGRSGSIIFGPHFGQNRTMGGSDMLPLDFLGVNRGSVRYGRGGRNPAHLDPEMKFSYPKDPF